VKWLTRGVLGLGAALLALVLAVIVYVDRVAGEAIERGATYALGVSTNVGFVRVGLLAGSLRTSSLRIANPPGFSAVHFLSLGSGGIDIDVATLQEETVVARQLTLDDVEVSLERSGGKTNYGTILANLKRFEGSDPQPTDTSESGTRFVVKQVLITNVKARLTAGETIGEVAVTIPEIRLENVGSGPGGGVGLAELSNILLKAILRGIALEGGNLPAALVGQLGSGLASLGPVSIEVVSSLGSVVEGLSVESATRGVSDGVATAGEEAEKALRGLGGLLSPKDER
jgi:hypothetical protein